MATVDLDEEFISLFFGITNVKPPQEITLIDLKKQLITIVDVMQDLNKNSKKPVKLMNGSMQDEDEEEELSNNAILIIDDLGVITFQLKALLSQYELDIDCSQEIYDAVSKYKKRKYKYIIMDLFIPTEREGFILLTEFKKLMSLYGTQTIIGVITASPRKEIEQLCKTKGADFFLEKNNDWQKQLCKIMGSYIVDKDDNDEF